MGRGSGSTRVSLYNPSVFFCAGLGVFKPHSISGSLGLGWHAPRRWRIVAPAPATVLAWSAARPRVQGRPTSRCPLRVPALRPHTQSPPLVWPASHGAAATRRPSSGPPPSRYRRQSRQAQRHCARGSRRHARFHRLLPPRPLLPPPNTGSRRRVVNVRHARGSACDEGVGSDATRGRPDTLPPRADAREGWAAPACREWLAGRLTPWGRRDPRQDGARDIAAGAGSPPLPSAWRSSVRKGGQLTGLFSKLEDSHGDSSKSV